MTAFECRTSPGTGPSHGTRFSTRCIHIPSAMIILCLLWPSVACAQVVSLGAKVGVNFTFPGPDTLFRSVKKGLMLGGVIVVRPARQLTLQTEFLYSEKGLARESESREDVGGLPALVETEDRFTVPYLEVPVAGRLTLPLGHEMPIRLHGVMGLSFAYQVGCRRNIERRGFDLTSGQQVLAESIKLACGRARSRDVAFLIGGGLEFTVNGTHPVLIEARYARDLVSSGDSFFREKRIFTLAVGSTFLALPR